MMDPRLPYIVNTDVLPPKETNRYLLNLGATKGQREGSGGSYRRNANEPRNEPRNTSRDPFAHRLINIVLRQAKALGFGFIDLKATHVRTGRHDPQTGWGRAPLAIRNLTVSDLLELIKMQVNNYIGKVAPRAKCLGSIKDPRYKTGGEAKFADVPMIIEWHPKHDLYWQPPILYEQTEEQSKKENQDPDPDLGRECTYIVFDEKGEKLEVEGIKLCKKDMTPLVREEPEGGEPYLWCADCKTEFKDHPWEQKGVVTMPRCYGEDSEGTPFGHPEFRQRQIEDTRTGQKWDTYEPIDSKSYFIKFKRTDITKHFAMRPLPFVPAKWFKQIIMPKTTDPWANVLKEIIETPVHTDPLVATESGLPWASSGRDTGELFDSPIPGRDFTYKPIAERHQAILDWLGGLAIAQPNDPEFSMRADGLSVIGTDDTYNVQTSICGPGKPYITPTGQHVYELPLSYFSKEDLISYQRGDISFGSTARGYNLHYPTSERRNLEHGSPYRTQDPFEWQGYLQEDNNYTLDLALDRFDAAGDWGMVQACTGSGKTVFCAKAIRKVLNYIYAYKRPKTCVSIVVPTIALLNQWFDFLDGRTAIGEKWGLEAS